MGSLSAQDMRNHTDDDTALTCHLQYNHYPAIPLHMIQPCRDAIEAAKEEDWNRLIQLPEGIEHRKYGKEVPACEIIQFAHLYDFLED